jgi:hypothetical protein
MGWQRHGFSTPLIRLLRGLSGIFGLTLITSAHVGSPDAWFEGRAGPYLVTVHIEAPTVVPGIAVINVRAEDDASRVTAFVNTYDAEGGTPPPDELIPLADRPGWRRARLWVMNPGSNRVTVEVDGTRGKGFVVVPLAAVAQRRLTVSTTFIVMAIAGAAVLVAGMLTFIGAAVRESTLEPGIVADADRRRRARFAMVRASGVITLVLVGTLYWWRNEDRTFRSGLYRPLSTSTRIDSSSGVPRFVLSITDSSWLERDEVAVLRARGEVPSTDLIDDHGKLMHLFLLAADGPPAMAHLHPESRDTITFSSVLPPLPPGSYRVYADIVQRSGFTQTLTSQVTIGSLTNPAPMTTLDPRVRGDDRAKAGGHPRESGDPASWTPTDPDDSWAVAPDTGTRSVHLNDGTRVTWQRDDTIAIGVGAEAGLRFLIARPAGDTSSLESYLGMPGHAAVVRDDGQVFIHLHPMGTISPAAQARLSPPSSHVMHAIPVTDTLRFPYAFPQPGRYTVWVQFKRRGRVMSAAFPAEVR